MSSAAGRRSVPNRSSRASTVARTSSSERVVWLMTATGLPSESSRAASSGASTTTVASGRSPRVPITSTCSASSRSTISIARSTPAQKERGAAKRTRLLTRSPPVRGGGKSVPPRERARGERRLHKKSAERPAARASCKRLQTLQGASCAERSAQRHHRLAHESAQEPEQVDLAAGGRPLRDTAEPPRRRVADRAQAADEPTAPSERPRLHVDGLCACLVMQPRALE